jgi:hypothetical protein
MCMPFVISLGMRNRIPRTDLHQALPYRFSARCQSALESRRPLSRASWLAELRPGTCVRSSHVIDTCSASCNHSVASRHRRDELLQERTFPRLHRLTFDTCRSRFPLSIACTYVRRIMTMQGKQLLVMLETFFYHHCGGDSVMSENIGGVKSERALCSHSSMLTTHCDPSTPFVVGG